MKRIILILFFACVSVSAQAASGGVQLDRANNDLGNIESLQRGAKYYVNYCLGCHSLKYVRYNSLVDDLQLTETQLMDNLMFSKEKPTEMMTIAMSASDSANWFGKTPPDLSLVARSRGVDWIYTYLRSFYLDADRPNGVNNPVLAGASMPHVLAPLQGYQRAVFETVTDAAGVPQERIAGFEMATEGSMDPEEFDKAVRDLVNFLDYVGEPVQMKRQNLGIGVLTFLLVFLLFAFLLKRELWKDIH